MSFDTILIANRGEIALRVMRTGRAMGYRCAVVYTAADAGSLPVQQADRAVLVPSYLDAVAILDAARQLGACAIHPGYGFLSENADFAQACADAGVPFIGPSPVAIALMGEKGAAKRAAKAAGVPCLPGYAGADQTNARLCAEGARIGVPLMVKAAHGGGGKGMRLVQDLAELPDALIRARSEAEKSFGNGALILERALLSPRHIEVQVFGDTHGNVVHLGERDCSVQRRHQKIVEEAPSPVVTPDLRAQMGDAAFRVCNAAGYVGAGTVEFLWQDGAFWFLEMNARLQVEHPVTEAVTGLDLVEWQIRIARGEALPLRQDQITLTGHAIEVRLYAEDPAQGFLPQTGPVLTWKPAATLRVDHALAVGDGFGGEFDPMMAKLIAYGPDREAARRLLVNGLEQTLFQGFRNNKTFLANVLRHAVFVAGDANTGFLTHDFQGDASLVPKPPDLAMLALAVLIKAEALRPRFGFSTGPRLSLTRQFECGDQSHTVTLTLGPGAVAQAKDGPLVVLEGIADGIARVVIDGIAKAVPVAQSEGALFLADLILRDVTLAPASARAKASDGRILAPMAGGVIAVQVRDGETVAAGQILAVLEAMKMEHPVRAPFAGRVLAVTVSANSQVRARQPLFQIEPEDP